MLLTPSQSQIAKDTHRFRVIDAGRRFGKSTLVSWEMFAMAIAQKDARIPYYAPTRDDARDIMWGMLKKVSEPLIVDVNEGRLEITIKNRHGGKSVMLLYGWESVQERGKGVGVKNNHIFLDEVSKYKGFWQGWQEILRPTLTDLAGGATFISTPNGFNHFYDLYQKEQEDTDYKSFHFTSYDNPYLPVEEIDKAKKELTEDRFAQEYLADFRKTEGLVYKEFNRARHVFTELPEVQFIETIAGCDFGFTHPCSVHTIKKDFDGNFWVTEEWYKTGQTDLQIAEYVASKNYAKVYPDPENAGGIQELKNHGVNVREVNKGPGSVKAGVNIVRELLKANRLHIHQLCRNTIQEFEIYSYPPLQKGASYENENPEKINDDAMDSLRYAIMMDSGRPASNGPAVHYTNTPRYGSNFDTSKFTRS